MAHPNFTFESAQKDLEQEKKMVAALKRLSIGHLMNYDPDLPLEDIEYLMQLQEQPHDDDITPKNLRSSRSNSNSPRSTPSLSPEKSTSSTPSPSISPARLCLAPEAIKDTTVHENACRDPNGSPVRRKSSLQRTPSIKRNSSRGKPGTLKEPEEDEEEVPLDANALMWVPANLHPEVDPDNFKNHVKTTVEEIMERQLSRKSSLNRRSSLSKSISRSDPKTERSSSEGQPSVIPYSSTEQLVPRTDTKAMNRYSNPSLKELSNELEQLSKMAGRDSTDAVTVARTLSASSLGYTDVEILAIDELSSTTRSATASSSSSPSPSPISFTDEFAGDNTSPNGGRHSGIEEPSNNYHQTNNEFALKRSRRYDYRKPAQASGSKFQTSKAGKLADLRNSINPDMTSQMNQSSYHLQLKEDHGNKLRSQKSLPSIPQNAHAHSLTKQPSNGQKRQPLHLKSASINPRSSQVLFSYRNPASDILSVPKLPLHDSPYSVTSMSSPIEDKLPKTKYIQHNLTAQGLYQMKHSQNQDSNGRRVPSPSSNKQYPRHSRSPHGHSQAFSQSVLAQDNNGNSHMAGRGLSQSSSRHGQKKLQPHIQLQPQAHHSGSLSKVKPPYDNYQYAGKIQQTRDKQGQSYTAQREHQKSPVDYHTVHDARSNVKPQLYKANNHSTEDYETQRISQIKSHVPKTWDSKLGQSYPHRLLNHLYSYNDEYSDTRRKGNADNFKSLQLNENLDLLRSEINEFKESLSRIEKVEKLEKLLVMDNIQLETVPELDVSFDQTYQDISYEDKLGIESEIIGEHEDSKSKTLDHQIIEGEILDDFVTTGTGLTSLNDEIDSREISDESSFDVSPKDDNTEKFPDNASGISQTESGPPVAPLTIGPKQPLKKKKSWAWLRDKDKDKETAPEAFKRSTSVDSTDLLKGSTSTLKITGRSVSSPEIHTRDVRPEVTERPTKGTSDTSKNTFKLESLKEEKKAARNGSGPKDFKDSKDSFGKENVITKFFKKKRSNSVSQTEEPSSNEKGVTVNYESDSEKKTGSLKKGSGIFKKKGKKDSENKSSRLGLKILKSNSEPSLAGATLQDQTPTRDDDMELDDERKGIEVKKRSSSSRNQPLQSEIDEANNIEALGDTATTIDTTNKVEDDGRPKEAGGKATETGSDDKVLLSTLEIEEKLKKSIKRTSRANQPIEFTDSAFGFPLPPPSPSTLVMLNYRFPVHVERAIYRLSHLKLANPKRSLREQVLLSNFMYAYLNLVDHTLHLEQLNGDIPEAREGAEDMETSHELQESAISFDVIDTNEVYTSA